MPKSRLTLSPFPRITPFESDKPELIIILPLVRGLELFVAWLLVCTTASAFAFVLGCAIPSEKLNSVTPTIAKLVL
jgi:hypothetical protein